MGPEQPVQLVEDNARIDCNGPCRRLERPDLAQKLARIDDQRFAHGLAALGCPGAAGQQRYAVLGGDLDGRQHILAGARHHHADGLDLVHRGISAVAAAAERVEEDFAFEFAAQPGGQG